MSAESAYYSGNGFQKLVGFTPTGLLVSDDESSLYVVCASGTQPEAVFNLSTYGDCCSESWWADVVGVKQLLGGTIRSVEAIDMPEDDPGDGRSRQEVDQVYGYRVTTTRGACDLIFRNSSNGYYGGSASCSMAPLSRPASVRAITGDWSA